MAVHDGDYPKRLFVRRVSDQVIAHSLETHRPRGQIRPHMALMGEWDQTFERLANVDNHAIGGSDVIGSDVAPDLVKGRLQPRDENRIRS